MNIAMSFASAELHAMKICFLDAASMGAFG